MLNFIGNVIWLITSWWVVLIYLVGAIFFFPLFFLLWPLIRFIVLPFGRELVTPGYLQQFREDNEASNAISQYQAANISDLKGIVRTLANIVWPLTLGWILAACHIVAGLVNIFITVLLCWTIVYIPIGIVNAKAHFSMVPKVFAPFGLVIISSEVSKKLKGMKADSDIKRLTG